MKHYWIISVLMPCLMLFTACGPAATLAPEALKEAIFTAAREDDTKAMEQYIAAGADINESGELNVRVLEIALSRGNSEMIKLLLDAGATFDANDFCFAIDNSKGDAAIVQAFIDHGVDLDEGQTGIPEHTPLMYAAENGFVEIGELLLAKAADINKVDAFNDPAVNVAAFYGQMEFVKMLVAHDAELNIVGQYGNTAVGQALRNGHTDVADYLKSVGGTE